MFKRILTALTAALAVSLVVSIGSAFGMVAVDGGNSAYVAPSASAKPLVSEKLAGLNLVVQHSTPIVSEKLAGLNLVSQSSQSSRQLASEISTGLTPVSSSQAVSVSTGTGFDWSDAGIGAGVMFVSLLALSAGAITVRRHHRPIAH